MVSSFSRFRVLFVRGSRVRGCGGLCPQFRVFLARPFDAVRRRPCVAHRTPRGRGLQGYPACRWRQRSLSKSGPPSVCRREVVGLGAAAFGLGFVKRCLAYERILENSVGLKRENPSAMLRGHRARSRIWATNLKSAFTADAPSADPPVAKAHGDLVTLRILEAPEEAIRAGSPRRAVQIIVFCAVSSRSTRSSVLKQPNGESIRMRHVVHALTPNPDPSAP